MSMPPPGARGSALLEAVIASALLVTVLTGVLPLVTTAVAGAAAARTDLLAAHLARQRLAQLQALTYAMLPSGVIADDSSRLDQSDVFTPGGPGLQASGLTPLQAPTTPWADWLDAHGAWVAAGPTPPPGAHFERRWGIVATGGDGCLRLWVEAAPLGPSRSERVVRAASLQCPWGMEAP
jgi:hypothetical protein